jgi:hypothetical protein
MSIQLCLLIVRRKEPAPYTNTAADQEQGSEIGYMAKARAHLLTVMYLSCPSAAWCRIAQADDASSLLQLRKYVTNHIFPRSHSIALRCRVFPSGQMC